MEGRQAASSSLVGWIGKKLRASHGLSPENRTEQIHRSQKLERMQIVPTLILRD